MTNQFNQLQEKRRSIYALGKNVKEDKQTLVDLIEKTIELSPSAFNSQTVRAVIAFGQDSDRIWDIVLAELRKVVKDDEAFAKTQAKVNSFKAYGTILYFTETATVKQLEADFPEHMPPTLLAGLNRQLAVLSRRSGKPWPFKDWVHRCSTTTR